MYFYLYPATTTPAVGGSLPAGIYIVEMVVRRFLHWEHAYIVLDKWAQISTEYIASGQPVASVNMVLTDALSWRALTVKYTIVPPFFETLTNISFIFYALFKWNDLFQNKIPNVILISTILYFLVMQFRICKIVSRTLRLQYSCRLIFWYRVSRVLYRIKVSTL